MIEIQNVTFLQELKETCMIFMMLVSINVEYFPYSKQCGMERKNNGISLLSSNNILIKIKLVTNHP